jgi:PGF-pre-PGF domain-containing protein/PGF-CTERM protein
MNTNVPISSQWNETPYSRAASIPEERRGHNFHKEFLNNRSKLVTSLLKDPFINLSISGRKAGFDTSSNIKDPEVKFKVNTSWMQQMDINPENVKLQRYNGTAWEILPTTMGSSTDGYVIYESQTPGFSPFAITAEMALQPPVSSETDVQSNVTDNVTIPTEEKTPGFEALFAVAGLLAVAYLVRRD